MNATVNNLLLAGDTFIQETHRDCGPFTKDKERIKKLKKQEIEDIFMKII